MLTTSIYAQYSNYQNKLFVHLILFYCHNHLLFKYIRWYFLNCLYFEWLCCFNQTSEFTSFLWLTISKVESIIHCTIIPCTMYPFSICFKSTYFKIMDSTDPINKPSSNLCQLSYILKTIIKFQNVIHKINK